MTQKIKVADLPNFDPAEYLKDEEDIAAYLVAKSSGITREALYKALRPGSQPKFDTISKVCNALGVKLCALPLVVNHYAST